MFYRSLTVVLRRASLLLFLQMISVPLDLPTTSLQARSFAQVPSLYKELPEYSVASGPLRTIEEATEYCSALGSKLPNAAEAELIYQDTLDLYGNSRLRNYDHNLTTGSFWLENKKPYKRHIFGGVTYCPMIYEVLPMGEKTEGRGWQFTPLCETRPKPTALTVCVIKKTTSRAKRKK